METIENKKYQSLELDTVLIKKAALVLRALDHELRQQLLKYIDERGESTFTEIYVKFRIERSVASQQLTILRQQGFVKTRRDGKKIYYFVNYESIKEAQHIFLRLIN